ncbi:MAG: MBOAT family protein [Clostridiales Family XIII bacterium]|nr:MBOAT family protein [Clostridiales Family XIII bacterium]
MLCCFIRRGVSWRNGALIVFSLIFYAWGEPVVVFLMLTTVAVNYEAALLMNRRRRKIILIAAIVFDIAMLLVFKYSGFLVETLNALPGISLPVPNIALPIGISFYTFQVVSYIVDIYRGEVEPQTSFPRLLLYVSMFPQLVAGPIVRYGHIAREIGKREPDFKDICAGMNRFACGLAKKAILANICGSLSATYMDSAHFGSLSVMGAWFGLLMYTLEIYFDFSAYSDMAIGMGRMLGFRYHENFRYPYIAQSVTEFWRRWHISLSSFFRDYVYIPLGGSRKGRIRNLLIVWALTGLWHGASWNFVLWGLWYFVFIALEKPVLNRVLKAAPRPLRHLYLMLVVMLGWVWFYFTDMGEMVAFLGRLFGVGAAGFIDMGLRLEVTNNVFFIFVALLACFPVVRVLKQHCARFARRSAKAEHVIFLLRCAVTGALLLAGTVLLVGNSYNPFIYFRF